MISRDSPKTSNRRVSKRYIRTKCQIQNVRSDINERQTDYHEQKRNYVNKNVEERNIPPFVSKKTNTDTKTMSNEISTNRKSKKRTLSFLPSSASPIDEIMATNNHPRAGGICKKDPQLMREIVGEINSLVLKKQKLL
jgi:hypothetical protein